MMTEFITIKGTMQSRLMLVMRDSREPKEIGKGRTPHHCPNTRDQINRLRLDTCAIVGCTKGVWLCAAPSNCSRLAICALWNCLGVCERGRTPSEEAVFGEDCDGVDDEDDDCDHY